MREEGSLSWKKSNSARPREVVEVTANSSSFILLILTHSGMATTFLIGVSLKILNFFPTFDKKYCLNEFFSCLHEAVSEEIYNFF
jgi:hypothetical protein